MSKKQAPPRRTGFFSDSNGRNQFLLWSPLLTPTTTTAPVTTAAATVALLPLGLSMRLLRLPLPHCPHLTTVIEFPWKYHQKDFLHNFSQIHFFHNPNSYLTEIGSVRKFAMFSDEIKHTTPRIRFDRLFQKIVVQPKQFGREETIKLHQKENRI